MASKVGFYKNICILNTAVTNGFDKKLVDKKITYFRRLKQIKETATLSILDKDVTYKKFTYHPWAHNKFNKIFKHHNIVLTEQILHQKPFEFQLER